MRIFSLLPAATEIVAALDALEDLVAVSHECDYPLAVRRLPRVTHSSIDPTAPSLDIDRAVREALRRGEPVIAVDGPELRRVNPDVILTQTLCEVCAVDGRDVRRLADVLPERVRIVSLGATDVRGVLSDFRSVGEAIGRSAQATRLASQWEHRFRELSRSGSPEEPRPRVVCVEWLQPVFLAGHWIPELVAAAGGEDVGACPGEHSRQVDWAHVESLRPDVLLIMPCGFGVERTRDELSRLPDSTAQHLLAKTPYRILDGNAFTSRPGPRLVEAAERIREALTDIRATSATR